MARFIALHLLMYKLPHDTIAIQYTWPKLFIASRPARLLDCSDAVAYLHFLLSLWIFLLCQTECRPHRGRKKMGFVLSLKECLR